MPSRSHSHPCHRLGEPRHCQRQLPLQPTRAHHRHHRRRLVPPLHVPCLEERLSGGPPKSERRWHRRRGEEEKPGTEHRSGYALSSSMLPRPSMNVGVRREGCRLCSVSAGAGLRGPSPGVLGHLDAHGDDLTLLDFVWPLKAIPLSLQHAKLA